VGFISVTGGRGAAGESEIGVVGLVVVAAEIVDDGIVAEVFVEVEVEVEGCECVVYDDDGDCDCCC